ncbi:acyltransferase family protein [Pontibacter ruber]|uniref:Acyltransferase family protein n=1 Tax=Pontibacter ruber TaxID=1343895 RepID=A0ABW5CVJ9_9BACT|nr:acyltransferase family protein [Pontibacter ruber]
MLVNLHIRKECILPRIAIIAYVTFRILSVKTTIEDNNTSATIIIPYTRNRIDHIDVARGLLILLVILGHSPFQYSRYLYWFHMPAFFIISGMLHKQPKGTVEFLSKRFFNLIIPYIAYGILIWFIVQAFYADKWE